MRAQRFNNIVLIVILCVTPIVLAQQQWIKNTFPGQGHIENSGPWKTGQGYDRAEWVSAFGVSPVIPPGDSSPLMLQVTDLATLQYSSDGKEFKRANIPLIRGGAVAFNPHNGNVGYALMEGDFVIGLHGWWRTEDKGDTWNFMVEAPPVRGQRNTLLEVNPNPAFSNHLYMATSINSDLVNQPTKDFSNYDVGLYRSLDNGLNWSRFDFLDEHIYQIRFSADGSILYVLTFEGGDERLNDDGGDLYTLTFDATGSGYTKTFIRNNVRNIDVDPLANDSGMLLDDQGHLYSFTNYGVNSTMLYDVESYTFVEINPSNNQHIIMYKAAGMENDGFIWSNDGGVTWNQIEEDGDYFPTWFDYAPINYQSQNYNYKKSEGTGTIIDGSKDVFAFWPGDSSKVLNWATNVRKGPLMSEDYGKTFKPFAHGGSFKGTEGGNVGDDIGVMGFAKNESGFTLTKNNGVSWKTASILSSPVLKQIYDNHPNSRAFKRRNPNSLDFNPINNDIITGTFGVSPTYIVRSEDFGNTWTNLNVTFDPRGTETTTRETLRATKVFWHNQDPSIVYVGPMKSIDGGHTFSYMTNKHFVTNMHEKNSDILISVEFARLIFISYDAGVTWGQVPVPPASVVSPGKVAVNVSIGGVGFDLRATHDPSQGGRLRFLTGGENGIYEFLADTPGSYAGTWRHITKGFNVTNDPYYTPGDALVLSHVEVDKRTGNHEIMYATVGGSSGRKTFYQQVYKSTDAGENWINIATNGVEGTPNYVSALWADVDNEGNFIYSDWDGLYMYRGPSVVNVDINDVNRGSASGSGTFDYNNQVNLIAQANTGFRFGGWEENGTIVNTDPTWSFYTYVCRDLMAVFETFNAPIGLEVSNLTPTSFDVSWQPAIGNPDNIGISGYRVFADGTEVATTTEATYSFTGLTENTFLDITVEAFGSDNNVSALSNALPVTTPIVDIEAPTVPTGLNALSVYSTTTQVSWTPSTDATAYESGVAGYKVYLDGNLIDDTVTSSEFNFIGLNVNTLYNFSVSAFDAAGNVSSQSSNFSFTTTVADTQAPNLPSGFVVSNEDYLSLDVTWEVPTDNEYVVGYNVYVGGVLQGTTETPNYLITGLTPDQTYNVEVEAFDISNNTSPRGAINAITIAVGNPIVVDTEEEIIYFLSRLNPGDTLIIQDGVYNLGVQSISNKQGTALEPITIMAQNLYGARITISTRLQFTNCDYLIFQGLSFEDITQYTGLRFVDSNHVKVSQSSFIATTTGSTTTGVRFESGSGGPTRNANNILENSVFEGVRYGAMILMGNNAANVGNHIIRNNVYRESSSVSGNALLLQVTGNTIGNILLEGNVFDSWTSFDAINVKASNVIIKNNVFAHSNGIIFRDGTDNIFEKNKLLDINAYGIWLHDENNIVRNNIFDGSNSDAIRLTNADSGRVVSKNNTIAHNIIRNTTGFLRFNTGTGEEASNNDILNNVVSLSAGQFLRDLPSAINTIDYNILHNAGSAQLVTLTDNNIGTDPLINEDEFLTLGVGSSAIGTGTSVTEVTEDIYGNTRVNNDIGHIAYPSDLSNYVSSFMFFPPDTDGYDGLPLEAIFDSYNLDGQTGDIVMLDAQKSKGDFSKYRWTIKAFPSGSNISSGVIKESVFSFELDDTQTYTITLELLDPLGVPLTANSESNINLPEPFAHWQFNNNTDDASVNSHVVNLVGTTYSNDVEEGTHSLSFNGSGDYANLVGEDDATFLHTAFTERSVSLWFKANSTVSEQTLFEEGGTYHGYGIRIKNDSIHAIATTRINSINENINASGNLLNAGWNHVVSVFDNGELTLYLNGIEIDSQTGTFTEIPDHGNPAGLGATNINDPWQNNYSNSGSYFSGLIDDVRLFDNALTASEVASLSIGIPTINIQVSPSEDVVEIGNTLQLTAAILPVNATNKAVNWVSNDPNIATVNANGEVMGVSEGSVTITATTIDGLVEGTSVITVLFVPVNGLSITPESVSLEEGSTLQLIETVFPLNATDQSLTWSSSNDLIATVSTNGLVTGVSVGTAIITATTNDGGFNVTSQITVEAAPVVLPNSIAHWQFNNNTNDESGNNQTIILNGTSYSSTDTQEGSHALSFNGTSDYVELIGANDTTFLHDLFTERSVSLWFKANSTANMQTLFEEGGSYHGIGIRIENDSIHTIATTRINSINNDIKISGELLNTGWNHVVSVFDSGELTLYLNGTEIGSQTGTFTEMPNHGNPSGLGATIINDSWQNLYTTSGSYFNGLLDDVMIFEDALDSSMVTSIYSSGSGSSKSASGKKGVIENQEVINAFSIYPNPNSGILYLDSNKQGRISIYNTTGAKVWNGNINNNKTEIDLTKLSKGLYLLRFQFGGESYVKKIVLN